MDNIEDFRELHITNAFLEPTGGHYSRLWISLLERKGCSIFLVGHKELLSYRKYLDLPDKDDNADALALLCCGFDFLEQPGRFLHRRDSDCALLRDYHFRLGFYAKSKTSLINRLRQDLSWQVPEIANISLSRKELAPIPLMVRWLSGEEEKQEI